jgi:hypothetical protein
MPRQQLSAGSEAALDVSPSRHYAWNKGAKAEIAEKIERAFGQFERGEFFSAPGSQADMEKRKAGWLREQH